MNKFKGEFKIHLAKNRVQWYWTLKAEGNAEVLCTSEMLSSKQNCRKGIWAVKRIAVFAPIIDTTSDDF